MSKVSIAVYGAGRRMDSRFAGLEFAGLQHRSGQEKEVRSLHRCRHRSMAGMGLLRKHEPVQCDVQFCFGKLYREYSGTKFWRARLLAQKGCIPLSYSRFMMWMRL